MSIAPRGLDEHMATVAVARLGDRPESLAPAARLTAQQREERGRRARRAVIPEMALRLSRLFGNAPEFWMNAQRAVDLWDAMREMKGEVARIKPLRVA